MRLFLLTLISLAAPSAMAAATDRPAGYPTRPVRILLPQSPGGTTDLTARLMAPFLSERMGQPVVIDNRPGAGSLLGTELAAKSAPDGYTLLVTGPGITVFPGLYEKLPFDPVKSFAPITTLSEYPNVLVVHPGLPVNNVKDLIALAKAKPGQLNFASGGSGTGTHLGAELLKMMAGLDMVHIPYKGGGPALNALMVGQVQLYFAALPSTTALLKSPKLKALGVTSPKRSQVAPDIPTIAESGLPGFDQITWNGILAPARTPRAIVESVKRDVQAILNTPAMRDRLMGLGFDPGGIESDAFAKMIEREVPKWTQVIKQAGIKPE